MLEEKVTIELAVRSDASDIGELSKSDIEYGLGWKYTPQRIEKIIGDRTKNVVVAQMDMQLAGFGIMTYGDDQTNLDLLAVKRPFRRLGIGSQIVHWLEAVAVTSGSYNIFVQVRSENRGAIAFYKRLGFHLIDEKRGYYRGVESGLVMAKSLRRMIDIS